MRTFYVFNINKNFYSLYKDSPTSLYNILKQVSSIMPSDIVYASNIFYSVAKSFNKEYLDREIFIDLHKDYPYKKDKDIHIYNNLYLDEVTTMEIFNNYVKIKSNKDFAYFFRTLLKYNDNYFVCDFKNGDYFYLTDVKVLV